MKHMVRKAIVAACALAALSGTAIAATEIQWWHAMTGANNDVVVQLTNEFNASQSDYKVTPVFKGSYNETLQAGIAAYRAKQSPTIIQVFDAGTGVMMGAESAIKPVADVLNAAGMKFDKTQYLSGIAAYYSRPDGTMLSFPYNSSSPIMYYNVDILKKAGIDTVNLPKTWPEIWADARKIKASGAATCGYTTAWLTWIHLENFAAWDDVPYATKQNGLGGTDVHLEINAPIYVKHFQDIVDLQKEGVFKYGGRTSEAKPFFMNSECGMYTDSSGGIGDIINSKVNFVTGPLPYDPSAPNAPQNTIPGGASLWVFAGHSDAEYKAAAAFFAFLSRTDIQSRLHQVSGYLPVTMAAYQATKASGFYDKNPGREQPLLQMSGKPPTDNSKGVRLVNLPQVRDIQDQEFEAMLAGKETAQQALDNAVQKGNAAIADANKALGH